MYTSTSSVAGAQAGPEGKERDCGKRQASVHGDFPPAFGTQSLKEG
jgi:hypothetical protein